MEDNTSFSLATWEDCAAYAFSMVVNFETYATIEDAKVFDLLNFRDLWEANAWSMLAMKARYELGLDFSTEFFLDLLARKQHDYGPENILKFGHDGLKVRLWDKVARYENLKKRLSQSSYDEANPLEGQPLNEAIEDTLTDMIGYVVIDKMLSEGWFERPLKADVVSPNVVGGLIYGKYPGGFDCT